MFNLKSILSATVIAFVVILFAADFVQAKGQTACPVSGDAINKDVFTEYNGKKIYFCGADCKEAFEANPEKYAKKMKSEEKASAESVKLQSVCPVMGGEINKDLYADHDGKRIYFCCESCFAPFKEEPEKYIKKMEDEGITVAQLQTHCPIMGGEINKNIYVDRKGKRIYFCCDGCQAKLSDERIEELEAQGIVFEDAPDSKKSKKAKKESKGDHKESKKDHKEHKK